MLPRSCSSSSDQYRLPPLPRRRRGGPIDVVLPGSCNRDRRGRPREPRDLDRLRRLMRAQALGGSPLTRGQLLVAKIGRSWWSRRSRRVLVGIALTVFAGGPGRDGTLSCGRRGHVGTGPSARWAAPGRTLRARQPWRPNALSCGPVLGVSSCRPTSFPACSAPCLAPADRGAGGLVRIARHEHGDTAGPLCSSPRGRPDVDPRRRTFRWSSATRQPAARPSLPRRGKPRSTFDVPDRPA